MLAMRRDGEVMCILHMDVEGWCKLIWMCALDFLTKTSLIITMALFRQDDHLTVILFPLLGVTLGGIAFHVLMWHRTHMYRLHSMATSIPSYFPNPLVCLIVQWASHITIAVLTGIYFVNITKTCACSLWKVALLGNLCTIHVCLLEMLAMLGVKPVEYVSHRVLLICDMQKMYEEYVHASEEQQV